MLIILCALIAVIRADTLIQVQALWRHGARNPIYCNWLCEELKADFDKLTATGMRQQYLLGRWLRTRYVDTGFLSTTFDENSMYIQTTDVHRTSMSAYSNLMGLYPHGFGPEVPDVDDNYLLPPNKDTIVPADILEHALPNKLQLLPVHMKQYLNDYELTGYGDPTCRKGAQIREDNHKTAMYKDVTAKLQPLINDFVAQVKPKEAVDPQILFQYADTFTSCKFNGYKMPADLKEETLKSMLDVMPLLMQLDLYQTFDQARMLSTPFFTQLVGNMHSAVHGHSKYKFMGYSAHDVTVQMVLTALNLTSADCIYQAYFKEEVKNTNCIYTFPGYASNVIFEVYNNTLNVPYVKVMFNGTYQNICPGQGKACLLSTFTNILEAQQGDFVKDCGIETMEMEVEYETPGWATAFFVILLILLVVLVGVAFKLNSRKQQNFQPLGVEH